MKKFLTSLSTSLKASVAAALCACVLMTTTGCTGQQTASELIAIVGTAAASLATIEGNPELAAKLQADAATAAKQIAAWKHGTPAQDITQILNIVLDDLNLFPISTPDQALIALAIAAVEQILAALPQPAAVAGAVSAPRPRVARVRLAGKPPKSAKDFKAQWNKALAANPALASAALK